MSLKALHIFFIALCLALMSFLGAWSYEHESTAMGMFAAVCGVGGVFYLRYFWRKYRT